MSIGDPLRRYELAERLRRLRADQVEKGIRVDPYPATAPAPGVAEVPPTEQTFTLSQEQLQSLIRREAAQWAATLPLPPHVVSAPTWHEEWWQEASGPTGQARTAFGGEHAWLFSWLLHERSGLPLVALKVRPVGSRQRVWMLHHVLIDMLDGRLLDIDGAHDRAELLRGGVTDNRDKCRLVRLRTSSDFAGYRSQVGVTVGRDNPGGTPRWQDHLTLGTARAADFVSTEVLVRHGLTARA